MKIYIICVVFVQLISLPRYPRFSKLIFRKTKCWQQKEREKKIVRLLYAIYFTKLSACYSGLFKFNLKFCCALGNKTRVLNNSKERKRSFLLNPLSFLWTNFLEWKMLTAEGKRKDVRAFTLHDSLYKIIRTLQRNSYIQIKVMLFALQQ